MHAYADDTVSVGRIISVLEEATIILSKAAKKIGVTINLQKLLKTWKSNSRMLKMHDKES
jgi:hypothetical protein